MHSTILFYIFMLLTAVHGHVRVNTISTTEIAKLSPQDIQHQMVEHTTPTLVAKEVAAVAAVANPAASSSSSIQVPKYNNFALSCLDERAKTIECQSGPYKYFCNSFGKLRRLGRRDELYCDHCDCIDLFPKPNCIVGLIGNTYCLRGLEEDDDAGVDALTAEPTNDIDSIQRAEGNGEKSYKKEKVRGKGQYFVA